MPYDIQFVGTGELLEPALKATLNVHLKKAGERKQQVDIILDISVAKISVKLSGTKTAGGGWRFEGSYERGQGESELDWAALGEQYGLKDLSALADLPKPRRADIVLDLTEDQESFSLSCELQLGDKRKADVAFLFAKQSDRKWAAGLTAKLPSITTGNMGPLGAVLQPYNIALGDLMIMAATASLKLGDVDVEQGLLLKGSPRACRSTTSTSRSSSGRCSSG